MRRALFLALALLLPVAAWGQFQGPAAPYAGSTARSGGGGGSGCTPAGSSGQILSDNGSGGCTSNTTGTGILTALGVNTGSAGAPVLFNGALGTPSSGTLSSATGLPISTGVSGLGTGIATALGVNVGSAGAPVVLNGALGTPSSGTGTNITGIPNNNVNAVTLATGTSVTLTAPREYYICTSTCTVTPPVPAAGYEFCARNDNNVTTVITMAAIGSSARYENQAHTAYGTAGTGTLVSGGAAGDQVCLLGLDSTHYLFASGTGTWTAN